MYEKFGKRPLDVLFASIALLMLSPLLGLVAVLIRIFDPGPVVFRQQRVGANGRPFTFYKFRSMPAGTGDIPSDKLDAVKITRISTEPGRREG